nr:unnamed protein product [Haemonchus contortus]
MAIGNGHSENSGRILSSTAPSTNATTICEMCRPYVGMGLCTTPLLMHYCPRECRRANCSHDNTIERE